MIGSVVSISKLLFWIIGRPKLVYETMLPKPELLNSFLVTVGIDWRLGLKRVVNGTVGCDNRSLVVCIVIADGPEMMTSEVGSKFRTVVFAALSAVR